MMMPSSKSQEDLRPAEDSPYFRKRKTSKNILDALGVSCRVAPSTAGEVALLEVDPAVAAVRRTNTVHYKTQRFERHSCCGPHHCCIWMAGLMLFVRFSSSVRADGPNEEISVNPGVVPPQWLPVLLASDPVLPTNERTGRREQRMVVNVVTWAEGLSSHRIAIAEILTLSHMLRAVLVEPCYMHGKLSSCSKGGVRLSTVYNIQPLQRWARILPEKEAMNAASHPGIIERVCLHAGHPQNLCGNVTRIARTPRAHVIALGHTLAPVLEVHWFRRNTINGLSSGVKREILNALDFAPEQYHKVRRLTNLLGLPPQGYVVYHWRSERHSSYEMCAKFILESHAKLTRTGGAALPRALLVSDIQFDDKLRWSGMKSLLTNSSHAAASRALELLYAHNFTKLDLAYKKAAAPVPRDLADASVWDLILAQQARELATCSSCGVQPCLSCAWQGHYADFIVKLRARRGVHTFKCWP